MSRKRIIIKNTISNIGMQFVSSGLPFLLLPFMLRYWGADTYGLLVLAFSVQTFVQFLNGAISMTLMKFVSEINETNDHERLNKVINVFWLVAFLNNLFVSLVLVLTGLFGLDWLNVAPNLRDTARVVFLEMGILGVVAGCFAFIDGVMFGLQRIHQNNIFRVSESILLAITALAVLHFKGTMEQYVFAVAAFPIITRAIQFYNLKRLMPWFTLNVRRYFDWAELKRLSGFSSYQIMNQVSDLLMYNSQKLIVQKSLGSTSLTMYEIANKPNLLFQNFISLPLSAILPACSAAYARGDKEFLEKMLIMGTRIYLVLVLPTILAFILLMRQFISLWLGRDYTEAVPTSQLFLFALFISCPLKVFSHMMIGKARILEYGATKFAYAVLAVPLSIFFINRYGIIGGVWVVVGYWLLVNAPVNLLIMRSEKISVAHFLRSILPILAALLIEYAVVLIATRLGLGSTWIQLGFVMGSAIAAATLVCGVFVLNAEERALVGIKWPMRQASIKPTASSP